MNIGVCFGGYSPMHQGHLDLIMKSKKLNDITHVIVCGYDGDPRGELLPLEKRYSIIRNFLQEETVKVHMINDTKLGLDESMSLNNWKVWLGEVDKFIKQDLTYTGISTVTFYVAEKRYVDDIYAAVVALFKGMAETEEATCSGVLVNQKEKILEIVYAAIDEVKAGTEIGTAAQNAVIKLMGVDGLVSECNVLAMPAIVTKVTSKDGLVEIFQTLIDNIDDVYSYGESIKSCL